MQKHFYTPNEVRQLVFDNKVSKAGVTNWVRNGKIPGLQVGTRWFVPAAWVNAQLKFGETGQA